MGVNLIISLESGYGASLPSSCTVSPVSDRLLHRSFGTIGFRDVTETNGRKKLIQKRN